MKVIDGTNLILGRLATKVAKMAILGEEVNIINCEKVIIVGKSSEIFARFIRKDEMGVPSKGPFLHRKSDRIVRRTIRGMISYKSKEGKEAFKRVMCYVGNPANVDAAKAETFEDINVNNTSNLKFVTIGDVSKKLGAKQ